MVAAVAMPEPQMAGQASFVLQGVRFTGVTGATDVPESELQAAVAGKIGHLKRATGQQTYDPSREEIVLERVAGNNPGMP